MADEIKPEILLDTRTYKMIHLKRNILTHEWVSSRSEFQDADLHECNIHFIFHEFRNLSNMVLDPTLNVNFLLRSKLSSDHVSMQTCFPWNLADEKDNDWSFDHCLIKMEFKDPVDKSVLVSKCFHVESESGKCNTDEKMHLTKISEVANFYNNKFISKAEIAQCFGCSSPSHSSPKRPKFDFVPPMGIEIYIRVYKKEIAVSGSGNDVSSPLDIQSGDGSGHYYLYSAESESPVHVWAPQLLPNSPNTDVAVAVGSESKLYMAHQCVLMAHSKTLKLMLEETQGTGTLQIQLDLKDVDCPAFEVLLNFCYGIGVVHRFGKVKLVQQVLSLAVRFQIFNLIKLCVETLIGSSNLSFDDDSAFGLYKIGRSMGSTDLISRGLQWMKRSGNAA